MKKTKILFHGSGRKLEGKSLRPSQSNDLSDGKENKLIGVYATDLKDEAIAMGIISGRTNAGSSIRIVNRKVKAVIYGKLPTNKYFYLHLLSPDKFSNLPMGSHQWVSLEPVKPEQTFKLKVEDYDNIVRKASKKEINKRHKKFNIK